MELNQTKNTNIDLTVQKERFKQWLATPSWERAPKTQKELAKELNVNYVTLSKWKDKEFMDDVVTIVRKEIRNNTADVLHSIVREAKNGSFSHAKLYLEYVEKWNIQSNQEEEKPQNVAIYIQGPDGEMVNIDPV